MENKLNALMVENFCCLVGEGITGKVFLLLLTQTEKVLLKIPTVKTVSMIKPLKIRQ
jgi:hypothetical protein